MKVTYVTTELPYPVRHGGVMATHGFIQAIAASATVSVLVLGHKVYTDEVIAAASGYYRGFCSSFECYQFANLSPSPSYLVKAWHYLSGYPRHGVWNKEADRTLKDHVRRTESDVVWFNSTLEAKYLPTAKRMNRKTVLTTHNVESDLVGSNGSNGSNSAVTGWVRSFDMRRLENMAVRLADAVTAITAVDREHYVKLKGSDRTFLFSFGFSVPEALAAMNGVGEEPNTICFIGSMNWRPNVTAAQYLVNEVMPLVWKAKPGAKCFLVGRNANEEVRALGSANVIVTGEVASVQDYYKRSAVIVVPAPEIAGLKVKLVEAMALGKAVVSTSAGAAGLNVIHGTHLMIADDPARFADAIIQLLSDESRRKELGRNAQRFVAANLSPKETERQARTILNRLMKA